MNITPNFIKEYVKSATIKGLQYCTDSPNMIELNILRDFVMFLFWLLIIKFLLIFVKRYFTKGKDIKLFTIPKSKFINKEDIYFFKTIIDFINIVMELKILVIALEYMQPY